MTGLSLLMVLSFLITGCAFDVENKNQTNPEPGVLDLVLCEQPRPQVCTREYRPVCATRDDETSKTYATGCTACSDPAVMAYRLGACGELSSIH